MVFSNLSALYCVMSDISVIVNKRKTKSHYLTEKHFLIEVIYLKMEPYCAARIPSLEQEEIAF